LEKDSGLDVAESHVIISKDIYHMIYMYREREREKERERERET
jgi:hypothetical protein